MWIGLDKSDGAVAHKISEQHLNQWLERYPQDYEYHEVGLFDSRGVARLGFRRDESQSLGTLKAHEPSIDVVNWVQKVIRSKEITLVDVYPRGAGQAIDLLVLIPLIDAEDKNQVLGVIALWIDPARSLAPLLAWESGEANRTSLVRFDTDQQPLLLHELELRKGGTFSRWVSVDRVDRLSVRAVQGKDGFIEGLSNSASNPVIAAVRQVPGSRWFLVTQTRVDSVYAPVKHYIWIVTGLVVAVIFGVSMWLVSLSSRWRERALQVAKEEAELAAKLKARFLDIAAHELRNPVTALSLMFDVAERRCKQGQVPSLDFLDRMRASLDRLSYLVVNLLDVSQLERGSVNLHLQQVDLVQLLSSCVEECQLRFPSHRFALKAAEEGGTLLIDQMRINQVIANLLDNAAKYTARGTGVEVKLESRVESVRVSISDDGPGMEQEAVAELCHPFSRGTSELSRLAGGLGLGLPICRSIIELHGGTMNGVSEPGCGSTFYFDLPRKEFVA